MSNPTCTLRQGLLALTAASVLAATTALAQHRMETIEECLETGTDLVRLPASAGGAVAARECSSCQPMRLSFDRDTRYYIGEESVSYARLVATAATQPRGKLYIFYRPDSKTLTRVRLPAAAK